MNLIINKEYKPVYNWYAIYTKSRNEKKVYLLLTEQGITTYLPLQKILRQWSDRKKLVEVPYINSYVFVRSSEKEYFDILNTDGVVRFVTFSGKSAPIPDWQIQAMKNAIGSDLEVSFTSDTLKKGELVEFIAGPMAGTRGEVVKDNKGKNKIIIRIGNIGYSLVIKAQPKMVRKITL